MPPAPRSLAPRIRGVRNTAEGFGTTHRARNDHLGHFLHCVAPTEVILSILESVPKTGLHMLATLSCSRRLHFLASQLLWKERSLRDLKEFSAFVCLTNASLATSKYGVFVESLTINIIQPGESSKDQVAFNVWYTFFRTNLQHLPSLRRLSVFFGFGLDFSAKKIPFYTLANSCLFLTELYVVDYSGSIELGPYARVLDPSKNRLCTLGLTGSFSDAADELVALIARASPKLETFRWLDPGTVTDDALRAIATHLPTLKRLEVMSDAITEQGMLALVRGCKQLETFEVGSKVITMGMLKRVLAERPQLVS